MTRGDARQGSGRESNFGRRLRVGALGTIAIGGAIVMGGAATLVTAFANTGAVSADQTCTTYNVVAHLDNNVDHRLVIVTFPNTSTEVVNGEFTTLTTGATDIFTKSGAAPASGTISETIYKGNTVASGIDTHYTATLPAPSNCTAAIATHQSAGGAVGTALSDTATVTGTLGSPAGSVIFTLFPPSNPTCSTSAGAAAPVYTSSAINLVSTTPGVSTAASGSHPAEAPGTYHWIAAYTPTGSTYNAVESSCTSEPVTVSQAGPSISTTQTQGGSAPFAVSDSATLTGGVNPTGSITFNLYPTSADCAAGTGSVFTSTVQLPSSAPFTVGSGNSPALSAQGTYQWVAKYSGDANNASVSSACGDEPVTIGAGPQGITTPGTGGTGSLTGITIGGFLLLSGLGVALVGSIVPRRRRTQ